jgi:PAS domain S-box-containing protein
MGNDTYRILVVDDSNDNRQAVSDLLRVDGYTVEEAPSGREAIDKFRTFQPHLLLIDVVMPDINGLEVLQKIELKSSPAQAIVMTGFESLSDAKRAMELGAISYVGKPLRFAELRAHVQTALNTVRVDMDKKQYQVKLEEKVAERTQTLRETLWIVENQHQRLDAIINSISEALLAIDCNDTVMLTNHKFHAIFPRSFSDIVGQNIATISKDTRFLEELKGLLQKTNSAGSVESDIIIRGHDGTAKIYNACISPIRNNANTVIGRIITFADQTEAMRVVQLRRSFLHDVADEMRAPLATVATTIDELSKTKLEASQQAQVQIMQDAQKALTKHVNRILDITRKESGGK